MRFASVCSGIGAAELAFSRIGWECVFSSEIEAFPSAVLAERFGHPNLGDFTKIGAERGPVDLLVGGTPCQSFSVAGKRLGLDDPRGNLALEYLALARRLGVRWLVWENVPGVLSSNGGRDFGAFLWTLGELGYGWSYRVLDAQYFGVAQRRRRVFVVGCLGDWRGAAAVLFEPESVRGNPAPRREKGQGVTGTLAARASAGGGLGTDTKLSGGLVPETAPSLDCRAGRSGETGFHTSGGLVPEVSPVLTARMQGSSGWAPVNETAHLVPEVCGSLDTECGGGKLTHQSMANGHVVPVASWWDGGQTAQTLDAVLAKGQTMPEKNRFPAVLVPQTAHTLRGEGYAASEDGTGRGVPLIATGDGVTADPLTANEGRTYTHEGEGNFRLRNCVAFQSKQSATSKAPSFDDVAPCLDVAKAGGTAVAFSCKDHGADVGEVAPTLRAMSGQQANGGGQVAVATFRQSSMSGKGTMGYDESGIAKPVKTQADRQMLLQGMAVRRLTPRECERLQGFPDDWTAIPWRKKPPEDCPDGPRYRAIGNSMAVPVMEWIGRRIQAVEEMT